MNFDEECSSPPAVSYPVRCVRAEVTKRHDTVEPGHDFCSACLAWLRGDEPVDPLTQQPPPRQKMSSLASGPYPPAGVDDEAWHECLMAALAACS